MAEVELRNVSRLRGGTAVVSGLDLAVADREFLVLLGPSGCGKTTTMRMIAGLEQASTGDILIGGRRVNALDPRERDVAMVFQNYALYPTMTAYENIRFPLRVRRVDPAEHDARVRGAAARVELEGLLHRRPAELSGGQRQRVALARAIVRRPSVFLMDEPLSNLDARLRVSTRAQLRALSRELAVTTLYVTHDQVEAMTLADRVVVMDRGVVQQVGTPAEIYDRPANTFVAGFIGSPAMNLMTGEIRDGAFVAEGVRLPGAGGPDGPVVLGFRAEDAALAGRDDAERGGIAAPVFATELLGDATMVTMRAAGALVAVKAPKTFRAAPGERLAAVVPPGLLHLFDPRTGARLARP